MSQLDTRSLLNNSVTDLKVRLRNNNSLRARNAANSADVSLFKLDASNVLQFLTHPEISSSASTANQVVTYKDLTAAIEGMKPKETVRVASTANIDLSVVADPSPVDGVTLADNDRILLKNQTTASENGIYVAVTAVDPTTWVRASDSNTASELSRAYVPVALGTANAGKFFVETLIISTLGTDPVTFVYFNSVSSLVAGNGIDITGTTVSINQDGDGLQFVGGALSLELSGSTLSKSAAGLKVANGGITATQLASSVDATTFVLAAGYAFGAGTVVAGDTIQAAIQKLDGNIRAIVTYTPARNKYTLNGTDITNQYVDLTHLSATASVQLSVVGLAPQFEGIDYTLSTVGGVTRVTFAGDLATAGNAALVSGDIVHINYLY